LFFWGSQSAQGLFILFFGGILCDVWCSPVCSVNASQAGLEIVVAANMAVAVAAPNFLSVMYCGEAFPSLAIQGVEGLILVGALFLFDGGGEEKERKKKRGKKKGKKPPWGRRVSLGLDPPSQLCSGWMLLGVMKS
jgi:hypothetical protein